jgi:hypothetical protein
VSAFVINPYVFPKFWEPTAPVVPLTLSGFMVETSGETPLVTWGDGTSQTLASGVSVNKTFNTPSTGIELSSRA